MAGKGSPLPGRDGKYSDKESSKKTTCLGLFFVVISFGYMLPWTSLGSLISFYKATYGANFYVLIYFCYYLPGLPVAILQSCTDAAVDSCLGSYWSYLIRGSFFFLAMILVLMVMINREDQFQILVLFTLLGISGWACHGTASQLASMHSASKIAMLQTGFRCPEIFAIIAVTVLHIGKDSETEEITQLLVSTAIAVSFGLFSWVYVCNSRESRFYFRLKDGRNQGIDPFESRSLLSSSSDVSPSWPSSSSKSIRDNVWIDDDEDIDDTESNQTINRTAPSERSVVVVASPMEDQQPYQESDLFLKYRRVGSSDEGDSAPVVRSILQEKQNLWPLCAALIVTIWCSIFQASFFAHVNSSNGWEIEQILYFTRLFCDLIGRPLTRLPRPSFMKTNMHLLWASICRISLMLVFFAYILVPNFPQNDIGISCLVGVFSVMSGYFTVLIYEYAAAQCSTKSEQTKVTGMLNISFQIAAFGAVTSSVLLTQLKLI